MNPDTALGQEGRKRERSRAPLQPVVSDFGISLAVGTAGGGRLTETGTGLGTPHYMSPEQAAAEGTLDGRSDLYSVGCVLYEMLVGEPPFKGPSAQAVIAKRFVQVPADVTALREGVPDQSASQAAESASPPSSSRQAVSQALERDPADAIANSVQGTIAMAYDLDFSVAARHYQHALELAPSSYDIVREAGWFAGMLGRTDQAIEVFEDLAPREPLNPMGPGCLAWLQLTAQRPEGVIAAARTTIRLSPTFTDVWCALGWGMLMRGEPKEARAAMEQEHNPNVRLFSLAAVHHELGHHAEAEALLGGLIADYGQTDPFLVAMASAWLGDVDRTFEWLDKVAQYGDPRFHELYLVRWVFRKVEDDPRWSAFLDRHQRLPADVDSIEFAVPAAGS